MSDKPPATSMTEALFQLPPPNLGLTKEQVEKAWDEAPPAKHGGAFFAALLDHGVKLNRPDVGPVDARGYTRAEARLGEFIGNLQAAQETIAMAIQEHPQEFGVMLAESAARLLNHAVEEWEKDWESDPENHHD